jgi:putative membrane protein (TIGR04086 family)
MVINKMKTDNFKIIIVGVLLAIGIFYFFPLIHTILYFMQIRLEKPLGAYFRMMVYLPLIVAGIYVGFSKAEQNVLHGALVGIIYYLILWLIINVFWPAPYFDHSFKPLIFSYGIVRDGLICAIVAWLTNTILKRRRQ